MGGENLVVMPLDVTTKLVFNRSLLATLVEDITDGSGKIDDSVPDPDKLYTPDPAGRRTFIIDLAKFMWGSNMKFRATGGQVGFLVHDASVLLYLFYPETLRMRRAVVEISTDEATKGLTWADFRHVTKRAGRMNAWIALEVDHVE